MLTANANHEHRPTLNDLTNACFVYKDTSTNLYDVYTCDLLLAKWVAHMFVCFSYKVVR